MLDIYKNYSLQFGQDLEIIAVVVVVSLLLYVGKFVLWLQILCFRFSEAPYCAVGFFKRG